MNNYITVREAAKKWKISERRVQILCSEGRIEGAEKYASVWAIPRDAKKPLKLHPGKKVIFKEKCK